MNPPKTPTPNDPLFCPSGANTDRPTRTRCPPCSPNPTPPHIPYVPHRNTPPRFQNPRLTDLSTSQSAPPDPPETITIACSPNHQRGNRAPHGCSATSTREPYVETATLERESMCRCCMRGERISDDQSCIPKRTFCPSRDRIAKGAGPLKRHRKRKRSATRARSPARQQQWLGSRTRRRAQARRPPLNTSQQNTASSTMQNPRRESHLASQRRQCRHRRPEREGASG
jgi:hypothetical protein